MLPYRNLVYFLYIFLCTKSILVQYTFCMFFMDLQMLMEYTFCIVKSILQVGTISPKYTKNIQCKVCKKYTIAKDNYCNKKVYLLYTILLTRHFVYFLYTNSTLKLRHFGFFPLRTSKAVCLLACIRIELSSYN